MASGYVGNNPSDKARGQSMSRRGEDAGKGEHRSKGGKGKTHGGKHKPGHKGGFGMHGPTHPKVGGPGK